MSILQSMAGRIGMGPRKSITIAPMEASAIGDSFQLDMCSGQNAEWPASVTQFAAGEDNISDNIRFAPDRITVSGMIANTPVTFMLYGGVLGAADAIKSVGAAASSTSLGTGLVPDRAPQLLAKLFEMRAQKQRMLVLLSWNMWSEMAITNIASDHDPDSGDTIPVTITFEKVKRAVVGLAAILPDAQSAALGAGGTVDAGEQPMAATPSTPKGPTSGSSGGIGITPPVG